jgi:hypothetical protein
MVGRGGVICAVVVSCWACSDSEAPRNPVPVLDSVSPTPALSVPAQIVSLTGSGFVRGSIVRVNDSDRVTTFFSDTRLDATLVDSDVAKLAVVRFTVFSPPPGGGESGLKPVQVWFGRPIVTSVTPTRGVAGSDSLVLEITGNVFYARDTYVLWDGTRTFGVQSLTFTSMRVVLPSEVLRIAGSHTLAVTNSGGEKSTPVTVTLENPTPVISALAPSVTTTGLDSLAVIIKGTGFTVQSVVTANGATRPATLVSRDTLRVHLSDSDFDTEGSLVLAVTNPAPGGGRSSDFSITVAQAPPRIARVTPSILTVGAGTVTLSVVGRGFSPLSTVKLNGQPRATTFVTDRSLTVLVPGSDVETSRDIALTVVDPTRGGTSLPFLVIVTPPPGFLSAATYDAFMRDIAYDSTRNVIYASTWVPGDTTRGALTAIDPMTASAVWELPVQSEAGRLAVSDDGQFLYTLTNHDSLLVRVNLATRAIDLRVGIRPASLGNPGGPRLAVLPGSPHSVVVDNPLAIYDDGVRRPDVLPGTIWGFAAPGVAIGSAEGLMRLRVTPGGLVFDGNFTIPAALPTPTFCGTGEALVVDQNRIYNSCGVVFDTDSLRAIAVAPTAGVVGGDTKNHRVHFFVNLVLTTYRTDTFERISSLKVPQSNGGEFKIIRWGRDGLAFRRPSGLLVVRATMVAP